MKTFREQCIECVHNGNQMEVDVSILKLKMIPGLLSGVAGMIDADKILVCLKHKSACSSSRCKEERGIKL